MVEAVHIEIDNGSGELDQLLRDDASKAAQFYFR